MTQWGSQSPIARLHWETIEFGHSQISLHHSLRAWGCIHPAEVYDGAREAREKKERGCVRCGLGEIRGMGPFLFCRDKYYSMRHGVAMPISSRTLPPAALL